MPFQKLSSARVKPKCHYFGSCGGCAHQDLEYAEQLELKRKQVGARLPRPYNSFNVAPAIPSPKPYHYRRMIALNVIRRGRKMYLGYIGKDGRSFVPVDSCAIADERINQFFPEALRKLEALPPRKRLRTSQIVLRVGDKGEIVTSLRDDRGKRLECEVGGKIFSYSVASFFQHNFSILEKLVETIKEFLKSRGAVAAPIGSDHGRGNLAPTSGGTSSLLLDLYSGVGLFAISLADAYSQVIGIEEGFEAVQLAKQNAERNGVRNVEFHEGKVEELLFKFCPRGQNWLDVILDPPRAGLKPEVIDALVRARFPRPTTQAAGGETPPLQRMNRLVYVSCNLDSLARDLERLTKQFQIVSVQPIDLFPQTKHIETIVLLKPEAP